MILALDTATEYAGLAVYGPDGLQAEEFWYSGRRHTVEMMPRIVRMLNSLDLQISNLSALAVSIGPGSFTGVRISLAVAKGIALPHKLPLVGVPTLDVVAYPHREQTLPVWAIVQAGRSRILAACYERPEDFWQVTTEPYITNIEDLAKQFKRPCLCVGELDREATKKLENRIPKYATVVPPAERIRRAGYLAEIATEKFRQREFTDAKTLAPIYVSNPQ